MQTTLFQSLVNGLLPAIDLRTLLVIIHAVKIIIRPQVVFVNIVLPVRDQPGLAPPSKIKNPAII